MKTVLFALMIWCTPSMLYLAWILSKDWVIIHDSTVWGSDLNSSYVNLLANMRSATVGWNF
jgi:hypothetical protein